ncbi:type I-B CRISPR-associated protein Cas5b [Thermospira aquatica]|uniref:Type I-B CRISPR-associated protein Cas5 n=1 Tax=Thermospira aquatica TaxID=2828656 RepID=A0AAX3BFN8_9SPIR|nr:type I-B CRISPR-associated protein Cas5b [Thermospira aquatica]URA11173.1 type I-B CRISPR-associated protein Cas5 [Thermospira aquatica]
MKVLVFDIWGDYGHFRKFYTTTSPLTFSFPPPPTIAGILGAIYGTDKNSNEYLKVFGTEKCKIALQILSPVKKVRMGLNLLETKGTNLRLPMSDKNLAPRTQIRTEFLKDPCFRIYISHEDEQVFNKLSEGIQEHKSVYTVSLGLSELLANFKYVGLYDSYEKTSNKAVELCTPVTVDKLIEDKIEIEQNKKYFKEKIPIKMNQERIVEKYEDVIFESDGKTLKATVKSYYQLEQGVNIVFF